MNDLDEELLEFIKYVECSNEDTAKRVEEKQYVFRFQYR